MQHQIAPIAALAFAAAALFADTARAEPAEPPISNPTQVVTEVTEDSLVALLRELGVQKLEMRDAGNGRKQIVFWDGEMPYNMALAGCDIRPGKCVAFALVAVLDTGTTNYSLDAINAVNKSNSFVTIVRIEAGKIGGGRIDIIDGGVTRKYLAINIASFVLNFMESMKALQGQLVAGHRPSGGFQNAAFAQPRVRGVPATPDQMREVVDGLSKHYGTTLRRR
jgi:hypothetical protein